MTDLEWISEVTPHVRKLSITQNKHDVQNQPADVELATLSFIDLNTILIQATSAAHVYKL